MEGPMIRRWFLMDDRLAWPFVAAVVVITVFAVAFDFGWRVLVMPFETYLLVFSLCAAVFVIAIGGMWLLCRGRAAGQERRSSAPSKTS
jgi:hypothetical protein